MPNALKTVLLILLLVVTIKPAAQDAASSRFYFPQFVSGGGTETTFVISNSSAQDASVRFTAYGDSGNLLAVRSSAAPIRLTAQSQAQIKASDIFDIPNGGMVTGWVKAESENPQLSAWMLISLGYMKGDTLDGLAASDAVTQKMVFSAVFQTADTVTGIALANPASLAANVKATLYSEGRVVDVREFQIPPNGHRAWLLNQLFQTTAAAGHVELESDAGLVGMQTFIQSNRWSAVPMQLPEDASELVFPIPPLERRVSAGIALVNSHETELQLSLSVYKNGSDAAAGPVNLSLKPHGEFISEISDLFGDLGSAGGVISIKTDVGIAGAFGVRPGISGLATMTGEDFTGLASFSLVPAGSRESILSPLGNKSSASIMNAQNSGARTRLSMIAAGRRVVGENEIAIGGRTGVSGNLNDLVKATETGNLLLMSADTPLASLQIESSDEGFFMIPGQTFKSRAIYSSGQMLSRISGGTVLSKDETVSVSIALNSLKADAAVQVNVLSPETAPPLDSTRRLLAATEFLPAGMEFLFPATVRMPLLRKQTPGSAMPLELVDPLTNHYQPSGAMATIDSDGMSASGGISHFSIYALTAEKRTVTVTPASITVEVNQTIPFAASVSGNGVQNVQWFVEGIPGGNSATGTIGADGFYTAPSTVPPLGWVAVRAVSVDDPGSGFEAQVTITPSAPAPIGPSGFIPPPPDAIILTGPVDPGCAQCHPYQ